MLCRHGQVRIREHCARGWMLFVSSRKFACRHESTLCDHLFIFLFCWRDEARRCVKERLDAKMKLCMLEHWESHSAPQESASQFGTSFFFLFFRTLYFNKASTARNH